MALEDEAWGLIEAKWFGDLDFNNESIELDYKLVVNGILCNTNHH